MYDTIVERVKTRLGEFHMDNSSGVSTKVLDNLDNIPIVEECVRTNIDWLKSRFSKNFSEKELLDFENNYESILTELTLFDMCMQGAEYQVTHNENGINREFKSKDEIFNYYGYCSYVKIL